MNKHFLIILIVIFTLVVGAALGAGFVFFAGNPLNFNGLLARPIFGWTRPAVSIGNPNSQTCLYGTRGQTINRGMGMMGKGANTCTAISSSSADRISLDTALQQSEAYVDAAGNNFTIAEIMEFSRNFYVVVIEKETGKAAFELLVDPFSGNVFPEYGPNMMWNVKYGHMGNGTSPENTISKEEAYRIAQEAIEGQVPGAEVEPDGFTFYGYYTFDYAVKDKPAGMLSVNGFSGQVWLHTWHGDFVTEREIAE